MIAQIADLFELKTDNPTRTDRPVSTLAFDWIYTGLLLLFTVGFMMDVWSHSTFGPDQSVFNEYHLLFYSSVALMGLLLVGSHYRNVGAGYKFANALPQGYGFALFGVLGFGLAGTFDLIGHALFGFENTEEALLSPTHLAMFITWAALSSGTVLATIARSRQNGRLNVWQTLPAMIGFVAILVPFTVMLMTTYLPLGTGFALTQEARDWHEMESIVAGFFTQTALLIGFSLVWARSMRLPMGTFVIVFGLYGVTVGLPFEAVEIMGQFGLVSGIGLEIAYRLMRPDATNVWQFRLFGFLAPVSFWLAYFGYLILIDLGNGLAVTPYMWLGIVFQTGLVGLAIATLMTLPAAQPVTHAKS